MLRHGFPAAAQFVLLHNPLSSLAPIIVRSAIVLAGFFLRLFVRPSLVV